MQFNPYFISAIKIQASNFFYETVRWICELLRNFLEQDIYDIP